MKIETREKTKKVSLEATDIPDRLYVKTGHSEIWVSTSYGELTVGVVGGPRYHVRDRQLVPVDKKVGVIGS